MYTKYPIGIEKRLEALRQEYPNMDELSAWFVRFVFQAKNEAYAQGYRDGKAFMAEVTDAGA